MQAAVPKSVKRGRWVTGEIEVFVHGKNAKARLTAAALPDTAPDVLPHINGDGVLVRDAAKWGLQ